MAARKPKRDSRTAAPTAAQKRAHAKRVAAQAAARGVGSTPWAKAGYTSYEAWRRATAPKRAAAADAQRKAAARPSGRPSAPWIDSSGQREPEPVYETNRWDRSVSGGKGKPVSKKAVKKTSKKAR